MSDHESHPGQRRVLVTVSPRDDSDGKGKVKVDKRDVIVNYHTA